MSKIISIHSYRGGTGKTNLTASLAATVASFGNRVGIVDTDLQSPGIPVLFGFDETNIGYSLNDYLWNRCRLAQANYDVTSVLRKPAPRSLIYLIPASMKPAEIGRVLREGYDVRLLEKGFQDLIDELKLDYLFIDTHPGLSEEILLSITISDVLVLVMRPDQQDFQGTAVTVNLARKLKVPKMLLLLNKVIKSLDLRYVEQQFERNYSLPITGILPLSPEMIELGSRGIFCLKYPKHPLTKVVEKTAFQVIS
ncbi:MAG: MinD/ParA family protein [Symploca sp. SIO3C6]|uniref:MinD/ParA family protein n=1 Tax=Symploca sp. SIO1C4 TaxID=2607765 RepID=A0A6B3N0X2_9CYAN|nr:MinD/ParA family protein [Symploca sp. SIO3C6]NER27316.1 MinD/ParA family protein [Symploca sp. SIO1C4]NET04093.1 MinD/ParA family protein [Symploca sp. SIO2B6]